jgi:hypothetical protein
MSNVKYAVCCVPVSSLRTEPNHYCEINTQLLFGEICLVIEAGPENWIRIKCDFDGEEGWCHNSHVQELVNTAGTIHAPALYAPEWVNEVEFRGQSMKLPYGSSWPVQNGDNIVNGLKLPAVKWKPKVSEINADSIKTIAFNFLNTTYLWGGKSVFGIDCSGFAQTVYKLLGKQIRRNARDQVLSGEPIGFLQEAVCGDLAFFDDEEGKIVHVGILLDKEEIIHASGKVRIDKIDNMGIVNVDTGKRTHRLRVIKRYF